MNGFLMSYYQRERRFASKKPIKFYRLTEKGVRALEDLQKLNAVMWHGICLAVEE
jgi:DNA-binding PadR family transcriptional regulator